jgi:hypothetical protein
MEVVYAPERQCYRADGLPKQKYDSFDEAFAQIAGAVGRNAQRTHVYRCGLCCSFHVARNPRKAPQ